MSASEPNDGPTAIGLFRLGDDYLRAAQATLQVRSLNAGPTRLLSIHACELYLKAYLRRCGATHADLGGLLHDVAKAATLADEKNLQLGHELMNGLKTLRQANAYVDARYAVSSDGKPFSSADAALRLATRLRDVVQSAMQID